jgi:hypothetical protein
MKISPPAFPTYLAENMALGMTLRDYFAAAAIPAVITNWCKDDFELEWDSPVDIEIIADSAYKFADAMMKVRNK